MALTFPRNICSRLKINNYDLKVFSVALFFKECTQKISRQNFHNVMRVNIVVFFFFDNRTI